MSHCVRQPQGQKTHKDASKKTTTKKKQQKDKHQINLMYSIRRHNTGPERGEGGQKHLSAQQRDYFLCNLFNALLSSSLMLNVNHRIFDCQHEPTVFSSFGLYIFTTVTFNKDAPSAVCQMWRCGSSARERRLASYSHNIVRVQSRCVEARGQTPLVKCIEVK